MPYLVRDWLQRRWIHHVILCLYGATLIATLAPSASGQQNQKPFGQRQFRENVTLPLDSNLRKRFNAAEELLTDGRWTEAVNILEEIVQSDGKGLVEVAPGTVGGYATYLNVTTRCTILLTQISAEGRQSYRNKVDPQAKRWFENWQRTRDESELQRIVRLAFLSSYGDDALIALGDSAWERGDYSAARMWWEMLIPLPDGVDPADYPTVLRYPDTEFDKPTILARIVLCSIFERDPICTEFKYRKFIEDYPDAEGWLAGRRGKLADCLTQELDKSRKWHPAAMDSVAETFGLSPARFRQIPDSLDIGSFRWDRPLPPNVVPHPVEGFPFQNEPLGYHPVIHDKMVLVNDSDSVRAWNVLTGEPAWPSDRSDPAVIYPTVAEESVPVNLRMCVGVPEHTMTIADGRLFARMGSSVTAVSNQTQSELESDLICLDLNQEGKLLWKISARKLLNDGGWRFEGTPVIVSGKAYVTVCRRRPQLELMVVCLDGTDGRLLWQQPIGGFRVSVGDSYNRVSHLLLTAGGGRLYLSTDLGLIVSLNSADGRFEWALTYEIRNNESPATLSDPQQKGIRPPMFFNGLLIVAPNDSDFAYCIETDSGRMKWRYPYLNPATKDLPDLERREQDSRQRRENQWRHLLGVAPGGFSGRIIASGQSLVAIDLESGRKVWQTPRMAFGRGVLAGDEVLLPGRSTIEICSQQTGQLLRSIPLKTPDSAQLGGNLTIASGILLVAQPNRLAAYSEFSQLKQRIERELTLHPNDSNLLIQLGELEWAEGMPEAARGAFERVVEQGDDSPHFAVARRKLAKILDEGGKAQFENDNSHAAIGQWQQSLSYTDDPSKQVELLFRLAQAEEHLQHWDVALDRLQSIIADERLTSISFGPLSAGAEATDRISQIIMENGRDPYARIEAAAARELDQFDSMVTPQELKRFIEKYPHSLAVNEARQLLADVYRRMDFRSEAYATYEEIRQSAPDDASRVRSTLALIELLGDKQSSRSLERLWSDLAKHDPSMKIMLGGISQTLGKALSDRTTLEKADSSRPKEIERTWVHTLAEGSQIIIPENTPVTSNDLSVLVCSKNKRVLNEWIWSCFDWKTGQLCWEESATGPIQIARWTPVHLLIGGPGGWQARSPGNGRCVWRQTIPGAFSASVAIQTTEMGEEIAWPVLVHDQDGFHLYDPNDGKLVSRLKPPGRMNAAFAIGSPMSLGFSKDAVPPFLMNFSSRPSLNRGTLSDMPILAFFQTTRPLRTWVASTMSTRAPWSCFEISAGMEPWKTNPFGLKNQMIGITSDQHLVGVDLLTVDHEAKNPVSTPITAGTDSSRDIIEFFRHSKLGNEAGAIDDRTKDFFLRQRERNDGVSSAGSEKKGTAWTYRNFAVGHALPTAWSQQGRLIVVSDGSLLMSFNHENGRRQWTTGLSDFPIQSPEVQVCSFKDRVFATSQGRLRGINIQTGKTQVETYLGDATTQWQTSVAWRSGDFPDRKETGNKNNRDSDEALLAIWPLDGPDGRPSSIWLCDAGQGEVVHRLRVDSAPRRLIIDPGGWGIVWTEKSLSGLRTREF